MSDSLHDLEAIITQNVSDALQEDMQNGDLTATLIPVDSKGQARVITRVEGVLAGREWFQRCFYNLDPDCEIFWHAEDGEAVNPGQQLAEIDGNARAILSAERCALNFLQTLSAVATRTRQFVDIVAGTPAKIFDTRKTLPGLRIAQKYAVRAGGGHNHRMGLYDGILIKENHIMAAGGIPQALKAAFDLVHHQAPADTLIEIEVETLNQLKQAVDCGARLILLDNFGLTDMQAAVEWAKNNAPHPVELEASGGVNLQSVRAIAETGVDRISIGTLTKDVEALDLSLRFKAH